MSSHKGDSTSPATSDSEENAEPNPNLHSPQFSEEEEQPNIMSFNEPKKKMFDSDSDSDQEPPPVEKPNEERPDTNWLQSSSGDEDIQSYMKNIEDRFNKLAQYADTPQKPEPKKPKRVPKFRPISKGKKVPKETCSDVPEKPEKPPPETDSESDSDVICLSGPRKPSLPEKDPDGNPWWTEYDVEKCLAMRKNPETGEPEFLLHFQKDKRRIDYWTPWKACINCQEVIADFLERNIVFGNEELTQEEVDEQLKKNEERLRKEKKKKHHKKSSSSESSSNSEDDDEEFSPED